MESWQTPSEPRDSTNSRTNGHDVHPGVMPWEALLTFGSELAKNVSLGFNHEETDKSRAWTILQLATPSAVCRQATLAFPGSLLETHSWAPQCLPEPESAFCQDYPLPSSVILSHTVFEKQQFCKTIGLTSSKMSMSGKTTFF